MWHRQADFVGGTAVKTQTFVEDAAAHHVAHHIFVVASGQSMLLVALIIRQIGVCRVILFYEVSQQFVESFVACVLLQSLMIDVVSGLIKLVLNLLTQLFIVHLVIIFTLLVGT